MAASPTTAFTSATKARWKQVLTNFNALDPEWGKKRQSARAHVDPVTFAEIKITYWLAPEGQESGVPGRDPIVRTLPLLQISDDGITAKSYALLPVNLPVRIELWLGEDHLFLKGRVRHCTGTFDGFKLGLQLIFET